MKLYIRDGGEINKSIDSSEVDAVFKATEWVIQELKNKVK